MLSSGKELRERLCTLPRSTFPALLSIRRRASGPASTLTMARQRVDDSILRSPISGAVAERRIDVGEHLGEAGVAFVIYQTAPLKLRFNVPERFFGVLRPGQTVAASVDPYANEVFSGSIRTVGGVIDPQTRTFFAEAEFANRDGRLTPGLFARVEVDLK